MDPELLELLEEAKRAVGAGKDPAAVDKRVSELTGGKYASIAALTNLAATGAKASARKDSAKARGLDHNAVSQFLRMAAQGATFGFADEIAGAGAALMPGGRDYAGARDESRARVDALREEAPGASVMAELAGGLVLPLPGAKAIGGAATRNVTGAGLLARSFAAGGAGAGVGALGGGLFGLGESKAEDVGGMASDAGKGALVGGIAGGVVGGATPILADGIGKGARFAREMFSPEKAGVSEAQRTLRQTLQEAGIAPKDVATRLNALGPEAVIADVDPTLARAARNARNQAPALDRAGGPVSRLAQRQDARGERLASALREQSGIRTAMGPGKEAAEEAVKRVRQEHYGPLEEAFPQVEGANVLAVLKDPRVAAKLRRTAPDAAAGKRPPSFTELQDVMMDLRDDMKAAIKSGRPNESRRAKASFRKLTDAMGQDIPGFGEAQDAFRIASQTAGAFDAGAKMATKPAREIVDRMKKLPPEAHDAYRIGLLQRWEESLLAREGGGNAHSGAGQIISAGSEMKAKLRVLFPSDEAFEGFLRQSKIEETFGITSNAIRGNSTTAMQASDALQSAPTTKSELMNRVWDALFSPGEARRVQANAIGETLMGRDASALEQFLQRSPFTEGVLTAGRGLPGASGTLFGQLNAGREDPSLFP